MLEEVGQVVVECTRLFEVLQKAVLSISFASLRLHSEVSCEGAAQVFEILKSLWRVDFIMFSLEQNVDIKSKLCSTLFHQREELVE